MRSRIALGIFVSFLGSACAPVASSTLKSTAVPHSPDALVLVQERPANLSIESRARVLSSEEYERLEKRFSSKAVVKRYDEQDVKFFELLDKNEMSDLELSPASKELLVIFILDPDLSFAKKKRETRLKLNCLRSGEKKFSLAIADDAASQKNWSHLQGEISAVVIVDQAGSAE